MITLNEIKDPALRERIQKQIAQEDALVRAHLAGVSAAEPKPSQRAALVDVEPGEADCRRSLSICFKVFAVRPCDWDNYWFKGLQDRLIEAGILPDDSWRHIAQGTIETHKVKTKEEERTEITISHE